MRVLVAGATGAVGRPLVAALVDSGHAVAGLARDRNGAEVLRTLGAQPLVTDVLDRDATAAAVHDARPDVLVDQLTALPRTYTAAEMRASLSTNGAVRTIGGAHVQEAAVAAGARRCVVQSGCYYYRPGEGLADESEPWVQDGPPLVAATLEVLTAVEQRALDGSPAGIALRYGFFYGPGTWFHPDGDVGAQVRAGRYPVLGSGAGRWSFVHIDDAVAATVAAVESDLTGTVNVCGDDPIPIGSWLPAFARYVGGPSPPQVPVGPDTDPDGRFYAELLRGADNRLARSELRFRPRPLPWTRTPSVTASGRNRVE